MNDLLQFLFCKMKIFISNDAKFVLQKVQPVLIAVLITVLIFKSYPNYNCLHGYYDTSQFELSKICEEEKAKTRRVLSHTGNITEYDFYGIWMDPHKMACQNMKKLGGVRYKVLPVYDGGKYVCLDDIATAMALRQKCLVYSLGINNEISFEKTIIDLGCTVYAYDTKVNKTKLMTEELEGRLFIKQKYIDVNQTRDGVRLQDQLEVNGHRDTTIDYLKIDVEFMETLLLFYWINLGLLNNVQQIGIEFHWTQEDWVKQIMMEILKELYSMGFRLISWEPNLYASPEEYNTTYHPVFEAVFKRVQDDCLSF